MGNTDRLDRALVAQGLVPSRTRAHGLIAAGDVTVDGVVVTKASSSVSKDQQLAVTRRDPWVSRAAHKLLGALEAFPEVAVKEARCLDAGASTGGFTQVLLNKGAAEVVAVDVGHDQLAPVLREDPRVRNIEGLNLRYAVAGQLGDPFDVIVADLSFISLTLVIPALAAQAATEADVILMVKPQFEIGRERLGRTGVVSSPQLRREAVTAVIAAAEQAGLHLQAASRSALLGQDGNAEFFLHLKPTLTRAHVENSRTVSGPGDRLSSVDFSETEPTDPQN